VWACGCVRFFCLLFLVCFCLLFYFMVFFDFASLSLLFLAFSFGGGGAGGSPRVGGGGLGNTLGIRGYVLAVTVLFLPQCVTQRPSLTSLCNIYRASTHSQFIPNRIPIYIPYWVGAGLCFDVKRSCYRLNTTWFEFKEIACTIAKLVLDWECLGNRLGIYLGICGRM